MRPTLVLGLVALFCACSSVHQVYQQQAYDVHGPAPIKRIAVAGWAAQDANGLGDVVSQVATDLIKLRKNYLVRNTQALKQNWAELCQEKIEGVFLVRAMDAQPTEDKVFMRLQAELYRCQDGALLWQAQADSTESSHNADLASLVGNYQKSAGPAAVTYAAPAFVLLQQIIKILPDPTLSEADVDEKIELGTHLPASSGVARLSL